ncbi:hypothetical protein B0T09DRAFT_316924 [Sordaria sp. MPI-SDFR-AT-0083]|nr:hypothetical protein B0T09DRAFT_316924 [Sordaria sp. MPI-SDFR-AT-0083]
MSDMGKPQLDDTNSDGSSVDSRGRRRRRNKGALQKQGGLTGPQILPRLADTKPVRLQLGLNLDVEVELKARLQGDVSLTLLVEKKQQPRPQSSTQLHLNSFTRSVTVNEIFHLRLGTLRLRQRWLDQELGVMVMVMVMAMAVGADDLGRGGHQQHHFDLYDGSGMDYDDDDNVNNGNGIGHGGIDYDNFLVLLPYPTSAGLDIFDIARTGRHQHHWSGAHGMSLLGLLSLIWLGLGKGKGKGKLRKGTKGFIK